MRSVKPQRLTRVEQQAVTRERLLVATGRVFSRLGYGGASIDWIAAEAGFSKGAVYSNFESKEAIFLELLRFHMARDMAELEKIVSLKPDKLSSAVTEWLKTMHADSDCPLLVTELQLHARRNPNFAKQYYALQDKQTRTLGRLLESYFKALSTPVPIDPFDLAASLTALAHGVGLQTPPAKRRGPPTPNAAGRVIDIILKKLTGRTHSRP
jgi:AcrR family transcriptional regulator